MVLQGLASLAILSAAPATGLPENVDGTLSAYYGRALSAAASGETQKALAMLELLLIPATDVVVDYTGVAENKVPQLKRGLERGFEMWREQLGDDFPFRLAKTSGTANPMRISFVDAIPGSKANHKGEIQTTRRVRWNDKVRMGDFESSILIVKMGAGDRYMTEGEIAHVVGHELGHALGLDDSDSLERIMGPVLLGNPFTRVDPLEVEAVKQFRRTVRVQIDRLLATLKSK